MRRTPEERLRRDAEARETVEEFKRVMRGEMDRICLPIVVRLDRLLSYRKPAR